MFMIQLWCFFKLGGINNKPYPCMENKSLYLRTHARTHVSQRKENNAGLRHLKDQYIMKMF